MPVCEDDQQLDDIEDIVGEGDLTGLERSMARSNAVINRVKKVKSSKISKKSETKKIIKEPLTEQNQSIIPGTQKIWVKTWGMY